MLIIGERINSTRKGVRDMIAARNAGAILNEAASQAKAGAHFIDVNCAVTSGDELQDIEWVISVMQNAMPDVSVCIDSPDHLAIERALSVFKGTGRIIINSITAEESRCAKILPLALKYGTKLIALTMGGSGMPDTAAERAAIAKSILGRVKAAGFPEEDLYFDPLVRPISTEPGQAKEFLDSIPLIKALGNVKTICGLSNISFGLPNRSLINASFLAMAIERGIDAAIADPLDGRLMSSLSASRALLGLDEYCGDYIRAFREGVLV